MRSAIDAQAERKAADAQFASARAAVQLTAPIAGTVTRIDFREGEMVPNDRPVLQVARLDRLEVVFMAESADMARIQEGQAVDIHTSALPGETFAGTVTERSLAAHPVLNQFRVRVEVDNAKRDILPGFPLEAEILSGSADPVLAVRPEALITWQGDVGVWKVGEGSRSRFVPVTVGTTDGERVGIKGDLQEGDQVVTLGQSHISQDDLPLLVHGE